MPTTVNIHDAKTHLSRILERVRQGETVIIAKAGEPVAQLIPYTPTKAVIGALDHLGVRLSDEEWEESDQALADHWIDWLRDPVDPD